MSGLTMLESTSSFHQSVSTVDTTMMSPATCLQRNYLQGQVLRVTPSVLHTRLFNQTTLLKAS